MAETVIIHGLAELEKRLQALPEYIKRGGLINRALLSAAKLIQKEAKKNAPVLDISKEEYKFQRESRRLNRAGFALRDWQQKRWKHNLRDNIVAQYSRKQTLTTMVRIRTRKGGYIFGPEGNRKANLVGNPSYWWLLEFGTSKIPAVKFLRRAFESKKKAAAEEIKRALAEEINKANAHPLQYADSQRPRRRR